MKKARLGLNPLFLIGVIYTILGAGFVVLGGALWLGLKERDAALAGIIFVGIGSVFLILGVIFLLVELGKLRRANRLLASGRYIWGEIIDCVPNYNVRINGRNPYVALVRYRDGSGVAHIFKSGSRKLYPDPAILGRQVKVYVSDDRFRHYYVDLEGVLPPVVEH